MTEREIFLEAFEMSTPEARAAYLQGACGQDVTLRRKVDELLKEHFANDSLLAGPALETERAKVESEEAAATMLGRYKLLEKIGEGGFGEVWMAEQREPVKRRVALKIIKLGMDSRQIVARFEAERQALAMMDHANIARIFDAGVTDAGRPYFVMELVRGIKITEYCDDNQLPTRERLKLFMLVCQAIQHAHQKGIIHRDIKPSNILVTLHDGVPVPKVIDFGIAKATQGELTDKTVFTQFQQFIGTPAYISPEQAEMSGLDIDTRADIYSLGVLLYELLVGQTPFDAKEMMQGGLDALRQIIREKEPLRPSTRLNALPGDARTTAGQRRQTEVGKLVHQLQGDLDWIVMKCLEKDRTRRYDTATGLAADIQRHLTNEPVVARPPSAAYKLQKAWQRNKPAFTAAVVVALALLVGTGVSIWQTYVARRAEQKAEAATAEINRNLYFAEMNLAGNAAAEPGGIGRIADLTARWLPEKGAADLRGWEWYYLRSLLHRDLFTLTGNTHITSVAWSPDGKRLASGSTNNTVKIWNAASRQVTLTLAGHTNGVNSVSWNRDGKHLASGSEDKTIKIWDADIGTVIRTLTGHTDRVNSVAWSPDGKRLASGGTDGTIKVWDAGRETDPRTLRGHTDRVNSVAWSPDGQCLASASHDRSIKIWDVDGAQPPRPLLGHAYWVNSVAWSPDGKRLASGGGDRVVRVWDAVGWTELPKELRQFDNVKSVSWSPDGKYLAYGCEDNTVRVQDATSGTDAFIHRGHNKYVFSVAWSPDGKQLASGSEDGTIKFWDPTREETLTLRGHTDTASSVAWSPDGSALASGSQDHTIKIWEPDSGRESRTLREHTDSVASVAWSPDGKFLVSGSQDRTLKVWDVVSWTNTSKEGAHNNYSSGVAWSPDGKQFASVSEDNAVNLYNVTTGQVILPLVGHGKAVYGHGNTVHAVAWSPDGKQLATASWDQTVIIWNALSGTTNRTLRDERSDGYSGYSSVGWSLDGGYLAAGSFDKTVKVWDAVSGRMIHRLRGHSGGVLSVSWSPDGKRLASASFDGTVKVWDVASGIETITLRGHTFGVLSVAWSPDGSRVASGGYDHMVKIWDARNGYARERE